MKQYITAEITPDNYALIVNEIARKTMLMILSNKETYKDADAYSQVVLASLDVCAKVVATLSFLAPDEKAYEICELAQKQLGILYGRNRDTFAMENPDLYNL